MSDDAIIVALIAQKGGGGKTTTSLNLAVAAAEAGLAPLSSTLTSKRTLQNGVTDAKADNVAVVAALQSRIKQTIETARSHGADFIVIDCPGHNDAAAIEAARAADIILIPVAPQMFHFETLPAMRDLIRVAGDKPAWVMINELHPSAKTQADQLKKIVAETYPFPVCPVHLSRLDIYANSADAGLSVIEQEPNGKAAEEVRKVYKFICQQVKKLDSEHEQSKELATSA